MTSDNDCKLVIKKFDDAIRSLGDAIAGQSVPGGPYSDEVYKAAKNVAKAYPKWALRTHRPRIGNVGQSVTRPRRRQRGHC